MVQASRLYRLQFSVPFKITSSLKQNSRVHFLEYCSYGASVPLVLFMVQASRLYRLQFSVPLKITSSLKQISRVNFLEYCSYGASVPLVQLTIQRPA